jgi:hypothetical protein
MKNSKHTPGPWKAFDTYVGFDDGRLVANCIQMKQSNLIKEAAMYEEAKQNAALIAAAPELLEALELLADAISNCPEYVGAMRSFGFDIDVVDAIRSAKQTIAKANGGSK